MSKKLNNYLRTYRKRTGLSQKEMAKLLGCKSRSNVSRQELFTRDASLQEALAYAVLHGVPVRELYAGLYEQVERNVERRARLLAQKLEATEPDRMAAHKLKTLRAAASGLTTDPVNPS